jgi:hypothetical protein
MIAQNSKYQNDPRSVWLFVPQEYSFGFSVSVVMKG